MPNLLIISDNKLLKADLETQIALYAPEFILQPDTEPDLIILDEQDSLLKTLAEKYPQTPVLHLCHPHNEKEPRPLVYALAKPLALSALLDAIRTATVLAANSDAGVLKFNRYELYPLQKEIKNCRNQKVIKLTEKETAILQYLYKIKGRIVSKSELLEFVWGYHPDAATHTIETHIYRMRQKVEGHDKNAQLILTEDGGYMLKR